MKEAVNKFTVCNFLKTEWNETKPEQSDSGVKGTSRVALS